MTDANQTFFILMLFAWNIGLTYWFRVESERLTRVARSRANEIIEVSKDLATAEYKIRQLTLCVEECQKDIAALRKR